MIFSQRSRAAANATLNSFEALQLKFDAISRSQAIIEFALDGIIVTANENFCRALGYSLPEIVGQHHSLFVDPGEVRSEDYRAFWAKLNSGVFVASKFRRLAKGGREVWIQASYNPVLNREGRPVGVMKIASDITEAEQRNIKNEQARKAAETEQGQVVETLAVALQGLSAGDLTVAIDAEFSSGYAALKANFNSAVASLRQAFALIAESTAPLLTGASEIAEASNNLSRRTEQQAASLEETAAALDQVTATVKSSASGAREASNAASGAKGEAEKSGKIVSEAVVAMGAIEQSSRKITEIIGVIDEIAFQTNLLALNAGVEAARAGDAGRGFAVVAQEVRALAQRSAEAAKEIKALISSSREQVEKGVNYVGATGQALSGLVERAVQIDKLISDIARSSEEQSTGLALVNAAVNEMDQVTQQNAAMVEQATAAAAQMHARSNELGQAIAKFQIGAAPQRAASRPTVAAARSPSAARELQGRLRQVVNGGETWEEF
ncbi:MAG TPA: methyl-accepting chemotaxis protein [Caulobacteraceae bacterium]|nr:methyl-accepting chemotaxis protein [Caulobacteraceae bacterium]